MGFVQNRKNTSFWAISCILVLVLQLVVQQLEAARTLDGDEWIKANEGVLLESLPRKRTPSSGSSPCTWVPGGRKGGRCTVRLQEMNVGEPGLGHGHMVFPNHVVRMGAASLASVQNDIVSLKA